MLKAGFSEVVITPPVGAALSGYFNTRISDGILDDLYAHVLVLDDGSERIALATCDLIGLSREVTQATRDLLAPDLPADAILLTATHTHTGPTVRDSTITPVVPEWVAVLPQLLAGGVRAAIGRLEAAEIAVGVGHEGTVAFNRRFRMKDGSIRTNPGIGNPDIVETAGPIDPDVGVLYVRSQESGRPMGVLVNYACHLDTTGGTKMSADYPGYLSRHLKRVFGERFAVLFGAGCCGDINHIDTLPGVRDKRIPHPERIGTILAGEVMKVIARSQEFETDAKVRFARRDISLPYRSATPEEVEKAKSLLEETSAANLSTFRPERLYAQKILNVASMKESGRATEVQAFAVGGTGILGLPGEIFVELGLRMKELSPFQPTFALELANDSTGYLPTAKAFLEGGYEASSSPYADDAGNVLVQEALETVRQLK